MAGFVTGVNAVRAMSRLIDMAADNIANANTPGYHVKRADVVPVIGGTVGGVRIGLGSEVENVDRVIDELVEKALLDHTQAREFFGVQEETLTHMEMIFGEPSEAGLDTRLGEFFDSVDQLTGDPDDPTLREQVVQKAVAVCDMFNQLHEQFENVEFDVANSVDGVVEEINGLTERIASLNGRIQTIETSGTSAPSLKDTRDQLISDLAELVNVEVHTVEDGVVNVSCAGTLLVNENRSVTLVDNPTDDGGIEINFEEATGHRMRITAGRLGGLLDLINEVMPGYRDALDGLADGFRRAVNLVHTTGLGLEGRFEQLEGLHAFPDDTPFNETGYGVPGGANEKLVVNVEDQATGEVTQFELTLDTTQAADAFLVSVRDAINATVDHVSATIDRDRLTLQAEDGYAFGFATPYDPNPAEAGDITAASPTMPAILDAYTGQQDLRYDVRFLDAGEIGTDTIDIAIDVYDRGGALLRTVNRQIDADYEPRDVIHLEDGLRLSLSEGNVAAGDSFSFMAQAEMDTAGVLDALGLNVLFSGQGARGIEVPERLKEEPSRLAGSLRPMEGDNHRLLELSQVRSENVAAGGTTTLQGSYHALLGELSTTKTTRGVQLQNQEDLVKDLQNRRDSVSGVSIDEEMIHIMEARTIYQGALKYITMLDEMLADLSAL
ncbi:MAG: flagellar hook-associated protein FlgK [Candidatus Brocadiia bacterium]